MLLWFHQTLGESTASLPNVLGVAQAEVERDEAAERGAAEAGGVAVGADAVVRGDKGQDFASEREAVLRGLAAAHLPVALVGVLGHAVAGVVDADDDQRLHFTGANGCVGVLADLPGAAGDERGAWVEEVLSVIACRAQGRCGRGACHSRAGRRR